MIFRDGLTQKAKAERTFRKRVEEYERKREWHVIFAFLPHVVGEDKTGHRIIAWLTRIERRIAPWCDSVTAYARCTEGEWFHPALYVYRVREVKK